MTFARLTAHKGVERQALSTAHGKALGQEGNAALRPRLPHLLPQAAVQRIP